MTRKVSNLLLANLFVLAAIAEAATPAPQQQTESATPAPQEQQQPQPANLNQVSYSPELRDPFKRPSSQYVESEKTSELESVSLDMLKVIGVIAGTGVNPRAIVATGEGKTFIVSKDTKIGNRLGVIQRISSRGIVVREKARNLVGNYDYFDVPMPIAEKKGPPSFTNNAGEAPGEQDMGTHYKPGGYGAVAVPQDGSGSPEPNPDGAKQMNPDDMDENPQ